MRAMGLRILSVGERRRGAALLGLLALGPTIGGCSFAFIKPVSINGSRCSHSQALPVVDTLLAAGQGVGIVYYATAPDSKFQGSPLSRGAAIAIDGAAAALFIGSAIYGSTQVSECREAYPHDEEDEVERRPRRRPPLPPLWMPPAAPQTRVVAAPTAPGGGTSADSPTPDAGAVDAVAPAAPPPPPRPVGPPVRQRADDE
jgi:hypothetical protein